MKKIFACALAIVMLFILCACGSSSKGEPTTVQPVELDEEVLRSDWRDGVIYFENGGTVDLPCTLEEIVETSGLRVADKDGIQKTVLEPDEDAYFYLVGDNLQIKLTFKNKTDEPVTAENATIVGYSYTNVNKNNVAIKFAKTLTVNVRRSDVEDSLGLPDGATSEDKSYTYEGRDAEKRKIVLKINFNSSDLVNSVEFHVGAK